MFAAYTAFGVTGFGASPITVTVLAHFLPLPFVLSLVAALDLGSGAALSIRTRTQADVRELLALAPFTIIFLALGVTLLVRLPRDATLLALGLSDSPPASNGHDETDAATLPGPHVSRGSSPSNALPAGRRISKRSPSSKRSRKAGTREQLTVGYGGTHHAPRGR